MNLDKMLDHLLGIARQHAPTDAVPYAFEQRIMARLKAAGFADPLLHWSRALWRGAMLCCAVMVLSALWGAWPAQNADAVPDFSLDFERAVFAQAAQVDFSE